MNTNEQSGKTLGQLYWETFNEFHKKHAGNPIGEDWDTVDELWKAAHNYAASAVEAAVLKRLGGEKNSIQIIDYRNAHGINLIKGAAKWMHRIHDRYDQLPQSFTDNVPKEAIERLESDLRELATPSPTPEVHVATESAGWISRSEREPREVDGLVMEFGSDNSKMITPPKVLWHGPTYAMEAPWDSPPLDSTHWKSLAPLPQPPATPAGMELVTSEELATLRNIMHEVAAQSSSTPPAEVKPLYVKLEHGEVIAADHVVIQSSGIVPVNVHRHGERYMVDAVHSTMFKVVDTTPNAGFWRKECMKMREEITSLAKDLSVATEAYREKDAAYGTVCRENKELSRIGLEQRTRAEAAEKRLSEVERELEQVRPFRDADIQLFHTIKSAGQQSTQD